MEHDLQQRSHFPSLLTESILNRNINPQFVSGPVSLRFQDPADCECDLANFLPRKCSIPQTSEHFLSRILSTANSYQGACCPVGLPEEPSRHSRYGVWFAGVRFSKAWTDVALSLLCHLTHIDAEHAQSCCGAAC